MAIKLLVVDDHPIVCAGLAHMLASSEVVIAAAVESTEEALTRLDELGPLSVVLLDVRLPGQDGLRCLAELKSRQPDLPVLMFSGTSNPTYVARALALGASGFLSKRATREQLLQALRKVASGDSVWGESDRRRVSGSLSGHPSQVDLETPLTRREEEVLRQLALGLTNKEIAQALGISYETVKEHVQHILRKLGLSDRTQAAVWAVRAGLA